MSQSNFDVKNFRRSLSQFPTGVTVITTLDKNNQPIGVTANSFNSVSVNPPLVLWSIDKSSYSLDAFKESGHFVVNVLGKDQVATSNNFASRGGDKFANTKYQSGINGCPILEDCSAQFECKTWSIYEGGDHLILVGKVVKYQYNNGIDPLVFAHGSYSIVSQHPETSTKLSSTANDGGVDFVGDYLLYLLRATYNSFASKLYPKLKKSCSVSPEEWRILARMVNYPSISISDLSAMVMQPQKSLRETVDWMIEKGYLIYQTPDIIEITEQGSALAKKIQTLATDEESLLLSTLGYDASRTLKDQLKVLINKLD